MDATMTKDHYTVCEAGPLAGLARHTFLSQPGKLFLGEALGLSGCEISLNRLPAGTGMPFTHAHQQNEEVYVVLGGNGTFHVDGDEFPVREGSCLRVAPVGARAWRAGDEDLVFACVQAAAGSLAQATLVDGIKLETKASWM